MNSRLFSFLRFRPAGAVYWSAIRKSLMVLFLSCVLLGTLAGVSSPSAIALDYNRESLVEADFSNRDLTEDSFTKANLRRSNLSHSNLRGVSFFGANLEDANLEGADLTLATLDSARLVHANLSNANLSNAFAQNAQFGGAVITGADFTNVLLREDVQEKLCAIADGVNPVTGNNTRDTLDCY
ncbi:pentapeptide repeat-containing protein [Leptolyngbya sp. AN02str]|uniref:pentapeptide repeat-containing protein n=1 Tax=Leptolyngbya sp. AN02str TaxID=3423363 RepID=UPI003D317347